MSTLKQFERGTKTQDYEGTKKSDKFQTTYPLRLSIKIPKNSNTVDISQTFKTVNKRFFNPFQAIIPFLHLIEMKHRVETG